MLDQDGWINLKDFVSKAINWEPWSVKAHELEMIQIWSLREGGTYN